jgi:hypothetical protein
MLATAWTLMTCPFRSWIGHEVGVLYYQRHRLRSMSALLVMISRNGYEACDTIISAHSTAAKHFHNKRDLDQ